VISCRTTNPNLPPHSPTNGPKRLAFFTDQIEIEWNEILSFGTEILEIEILHNLGENTEINQTIKILKDSNEFMQRKTVIKNLKVFV